MARINVVSRLNKINAKIKIDIVTCDLSLFKNEADRIIFFHSKTLEIINVKHKYTTRKDE